MSYLSKLKVNKVSKLKVVFNATKYAEFPDAVYVMPAKKTFIIVWAAQLNKYSALTEADLMNVENVLGIERSFYQLILLSACLKDGTKLGDAFDDHDIEVITNIISNGAAKDLFMAAATINAIPKQLADFYMQFVIGLNEIDLGKKPTRRTTKKKK